MATCSHKRAHVSTIIHTHEDALRSGGHKIKVLEKRRGSGGAKRALVSNDRENDHENAVLGDAGQRLVLVLRVVSF